MINPLVTVYITNYNYGRYVAQSIESVLAQSFRNFELIIIDDGSTDESRDIIRQYEHRPNVRIFFQENKGLNATNNIAVSAARGQYVMRLDADDYLDPNALLVMSSVLEDNYEIAMVFPDYFYVDSSGNVIGQERRHDFENDVTLFDQPAHGACSMIRKDCLIEVQAYTDGYRCQDGYDLWLKIIDRYQVKNVNLPLFYYRRHNNNLTNNHELILRTRADILSHHAERTARPQLNTVAVIPVLGPGFDPHCLSLTPLAGKPLICWTIDEALQVKSINEVIVTSPDEELLKWLAGQYGDRVTLHHRNPDLALENQPYEAAIRLSLSNLRMGSDPDALFILNTEFPLRSSFYLDKAVNVMRIFDVDVVIGVVPENDLFFQHAGSGLKLVGNNLAANKMRIERDYIYRQVGGMSLSRIGHYLNNSSDLLDGRIGHVVLSRAAACAVRMPIDLQIAEVFVSDGVKR